MSRQLTLHKTFAKQKTFKFVCYKNPSGNYESFVERFCLRTKNNFFVKRDLVEQAQRKWRDIYKNDKEKVIEYLKLRKGEKDFVR